MVADSELSDGNQETSEIKPRGMVRLETLLATDTFSIKVPVW